MWKKKFGVYFICEFSASPASERDVDEIKLAIYFNCFE